MIITTNVRLPEEQWKALKIMAVHAGTSVSELVRRGINYILESQNKVRGTVSLKTKVRVGKGARRADPFFEAIGIGSGGPSDDSLRHDLYLYGKR